MGTRIQVERWCGCGREAHPNYGSLCEDCWAELQPDVERSDVLAVPRAARPLITPALGGLYCWIVDDGSRDAPAVRERARQVPPRVTALP